MKCQHSLILCIACYAEHDKTRLPWTKTNQTRRRNTILLKSDPQRRQ